MNILNLCDPADIILLADESTFEEVQNIEYRANSSILESFIDDFIDEDDDIDSGDIENEEDYIGLYDCTDADCCEDIAIQLFPVIDPDCVSIDYVLDISGI